LLSHPRDRTARDSADADKRIDLRGFDLSWRQIQPAQGSFDEDAEGSAYDMDLPSFASQNADPRPFWMRLFASATTWAPAWLPPCVGAAEARCAANGDVQDR
jgi:hypothetical protein